jgi:hypothetical protein
MGTFPATVVIATTRTSAAGLADLFEVSILRGAIAINRESRQRRIQAQYLSDVVRVERSLAPA